MPEKATKADVVVVAAGRGIRMGGGLPKQFLHLGGKPVLLWSLEVFQKHPHVEHIVVVGQEDWLSYIASEIVDAFGISRVKKVVSGGERRQDSVLAGIRALEADRPVLVHDAARPFITLSLVDRVLNGLTDADACVPGISVADTVKRIEDGWVVETPPRDALRLIQTPQAFHRTSLLDYFARAETTQHTFTDEAAMVEFFGGRVRVVDGEPFNLKITRQIDLKILEKILEEKGF